MRWKWTITGTDLEGEVEMPDGLATGTPLEIAMDKLKYGTAYIGPDGKRIDPTTIHPSDD